MAKDKDKNPATEWHNKGEQDYVNGKYNPPRSWIAETTIASDQDRENCKSYREGRENAKKQEK